MNKSYVEDKIEKPEEGELLETFQTAIGDIRYILNQYAGKHPAEAFETISKLVYDKRLKGVKQ